MSENLPAVRNGNAPAVQPSVFDEEQKALIKNTVAQGATDTELQLFLATSERLGLDPILKEIYFILREWDGRDGRHHRVVTIQVGIDGYRKRSHENPDFQGYAGPWWCGPDGKWVDVWLKDEPPAAAKIGVYKRGCREAIYAVARYTSYVQGKTWNGVFTPTDKWAESPDNQLAICAERQAIRKAFPRIIKDIQTAAGADAQVEDVEWEPMTDPESGKMLTAGGPAYTPEKENASFMRKVHKAGEDKDLDHQDLHDLAISVMQSKGIAVESLSELDETARDGFLAWIERTDEKTLRGRLQVIRNPRMEPGAWTSTNGAAETYDAGTEAHSQPEPEPEAAKPETKPGTTETKPATTETKKEPAKTAVKCQKCRAEITDEQARVSHEVYNRRLCGKCAFDADASHRARSKPLENAEHVPDAAPDEDVFAGSAMEGM